MRCLYGTPQSAWPQAEFLCHQCSGEGGNPKRFPTTACRSRVPRKSRGPVCGTFSALCSAKVPNPQLKACGNPLLANLRLSGILAITLGHIYPINGSSVLGRTSSATRFGSSLCWERGFHRAQKLMPCFQEKRSVFPNLICKYHLIVIY